MFVSWGGSPWRRHLFYTSTLWNGTRLRIEKKTHSFILQTISIILQLILLSSHHSMVKTQCLACTCLNMSTCLCEIWFCEHVFRRNLILLFIGNRSKRGKQVKKYQLKLFILHLHLYLMCKHDISSHQFTVRLNSWYERHSRCIIFPGMLLELNHGLCVK